MDLSNKLSLQHGLRQELKLTPEMRLRLDVLHATNQELLGIIEKEMAENPLLDDVFQEEDNDVVKKEERDTHEEKEYSGGADNEGAEAEAHDHDEPHPSGEQADEPDESYGETGGVEVGEGAKFDEIDSGSYENLWGQDNNEPSDRGAGEYNPEVGKIAANNINNLRTDDRSTLAEELIRQLNAADTDDAVYRAAYELINALDEKGFLPADLTGLTQATGIAEPDMKKALELLLSFEPAGVGSSDTRECLLLQLKHRGLQETLTYRMVDRHFNLLAKQDYARLAAALKAKETDIKKAEKVLKELNPFPASGYSSQENEYVVPDIIVDEDENGKPVVHVPERFPEIRVNKRLIKEYGENKQTREFIRSYVNRVREIIRALEERNKTIENVVKKILTRQEGFMRDEEAGLKPLTLKEIAEEVGVAESTVSRIVSKKYIQMPSGVYPLKHFFTSGMETSSGERVSDESIKARIRDMIEAEDKSKPLTDTAIEQKLNESGVKIARRTVTKYREQLGMGPVNLRRKQ